MWDADDPEYYDYGMDTYDDPRYRCKVCGDWDDLYVPSCGYCYSCVDRMVDQAEEDLEVLYGKGGLERIPNKGKDGVNGQDIRSRRSRRRSFSTNSYKQSRRNAERAKDEA